MAGNAPPPVKVDRHTTPPFLLRLFYKQNAFNRLDEFVPNTRLPASLQIYTWQSCTLRELSTLLLSALPNLLQKPYPGTRIAFRLVYPDLAGSQRPGAVGRYLSRELGSVVVGEGLIPEDANEEDAKPNIDTIMGDDDDDETSKTNGDHTKSTSTKRSGVNSTTEALANLTGGEPDKTLHDARFVVGDYICAAILPPLADGSVQNVPPAPPPSGPSRGGGGYREGGGAYRGGGGGGGRFSFSDDRRGGGGGSGVPQGEWRRGEAPPERERDRDRDFGNSGWRGGYRGAGSGGGRGRGRW